MTARRFADHYLLFPPHVLKVSLELRVLQSPVPQQLNNADLMAPFSDGMREACEAIGDIIAFWGFKRVLGRIWTLLYLSSEALPAAQIGKTLGLSTGAVSMALTEMEHWGIVTRESSQGRRQFQHRAETRIWQMVTRVVRMRELHQLGKLESILEGSLSKLDPHSYAAGRLKRLVTIVQCGTQVFRIGFQDQALDLAALQKIIQIRQIFQKT